MKGLDNYQDILNEVDGIMVARGDLGSCSLIPFTRIHTVGVEIPIEKVANAQKMMIRHCNLKVSQNNSRA